MKDILWLLEKNALTRSAILTTSAAMSDVAVPTGRSSSSPAIPSEEKELTLGDLAKTDAKEWLGLKRRFWVLPESCRAIRRNVSKSVSKSVGLDVERTNDAVVA